MRGTAILSRVKPSLLATAALLAILIAIYGPGIGKGFVKDDVGVGGRQSRDVVERRAGAAVPHRRLLSTVVAATFALDRASMDWRRSGSASRI